MALDGRVSRVEQLHKCRACGLSTIALRENLKATLEVIQRLSPKEAERIIGELKRIWTAQ